MKREQVEDLIKLETGAIVDLSRVIEKEESDFEFPISGS